MNYYALATDYDGTLAKHGKVDQQTIDALQRFKSTGRKLVLVTGRELDELLEVFPETDIFDVVVAENGALLYYPASKEEKKLGDSPSELFVLELENRGVERISVGRVIVATWRPFETKVLEVIRDLGLEYQVIFNKDAVMVLPSGINKATGLKSALQTIGLSPHNVVAIGDAENDHAFLKLCEFSASVDNALPMLKESSDLVMKGSHGTGVRELIDMVISNDLAGFDQFFRRNKIVLGYDTAGAEVVLSPLNENLILTGTSGAGKSTFAASFMERLIEQEYQFCIIDPEGDYETFEGGILIGNNKRAPDISEIMGILEKPDRNCVISLLGIALEHRPAFFETLLPPLLELKQRTGRPHWIIIDETHHLLPFERENMILPMPDDINGIMLITVHPEHISRQALALMDAAVAIGESPGRTLARYSQQAGLKPPDIKEERLEPGEAILWKNSYARGYVRFNTIPSKSERKRHVRKYTEGTLPEERSFYFRGAERKLNLRAQNLQIFIQMAEGVDDQTWQFHLKNHDYSNWFSEMIKDPELGQEARDIEDQSGLSASESRQQIKRIIEKRYIPA
ncbi:MAG: HAD-IIB family hydrolase [Methanococcaceae archaeon]